MKQIVPRGFSIGAVLPGPSDKFVFCVLALVTEPEDGRGPWRVQALEEAPARYSSAEQGDLLLSIAHRLWERYPNREIRMQLECHDVGDPEVDRVTRQVRDAVQSSISVRAVTLAEDGGSVSRTRSSPIVRRDLASQVRMAVDGHMLVLGSGKRGEELREGLNGYTERLPNLTDEEGRRRRKGDAQFLALAIAIDQAHRMSYAYPGGTEWPVRRLHPDEVDDYREQAAVMRYEAEEFRYALDHLQRPMRSASMEYEQEVAVLQFLMEHCADEAEVLDQIAGRGMYVQPPIKGEPRVPAYLRSIDRGPADPRFGTAASRSSLFRRPW